MLHFCPNRGFLTFPAFELPWSPGRLLFDLRRAAIDLVTNGLAGVVFDHGILSLVGTEISAVPVHDAFFSSQQFRKHCDVMNIGGCHLDSVNQTTVLVHANMSLVAKVPCIALLRLVCFRATTCENSPPVSRSVSADSGIGPECPHWGPNCWIPRRRIPKKPGCRSLRPPSPRLTDHTGFETGKVDASICPLDFMNNETTQITKVVSICLEMCGDHMHCHAEFHTHLEEKTADAVLFKHPAKTFRPLTVLLYRSLKKISAPMCTQGRRLLYTVYFCQRFWGTAQSHSGSFTVEPAF